MPSKAILLLKELCIRNFRSIADEAFTFGSFTALVGKNDVGKSNLLDCLRILLEGSAGSIREEDFYNPEEPIEMSASLLGAADYLELCDERNRTKVQQRIDQNGTLHIRRIARRGEGLGKIEILNPESGAYETPTGIDAAIRPMLPEVVFIEALADVKEELGGTQKDALGKLVGQVVAGIAAQVEPTLQAAYREANSKLNVQPDGTDTRVSEIQGIEDEVTQYLRETFPQSAIRLRVDLPSVQTILAKVGVLVREGKHEDPYYRRGHGLQRALYLSMLRALAMRIRKAPEEAVVRPFIILFEEPEAFLHPNGQIKMRAALQTIASRAQVVIATHSPVMVTADSVGRTMRLEKRFGDDLPKPVTKRFGPIDETTLTATQKELLHLFAIQRSSKFLFSRGVVLVEGEGDEHLFSALMAALGGFDLEASEVAIVEMGGKHHIAACAEVLRTLGLKVWAVVDLDFLWNGAGAVLGSDADVSQFVEHAKRLARYDEDPEEDKEEKKRRMKEASCTALVARRNVVCDKLAGLGIHVLRNGETEEYVGLGKHSKGQYLKAAAEVRAGTRPINNPDDLQGIIGEIKAWVAGG